MSTPKEEYEAKLTDEQRASLERGRKFVEEIKAAQAEGRSKPITDPTGHFNLNHAIGQNDYNDERLREQTEDKDK